MSGDDADHFSIRKDADGEGVLSFGIRPDFENPANLDSDNMYEVTIEADDGNGTSVSVGTFDVIVTVTGVDETPEITGAESAYDFAEIEWDTQTADIDLMWPTSTRATKRVKP